MGINITGTTAGALYPRYSPDPQHDGHSLWGLSVGSPDDIHIMYGDRDKVTGYLLAGIDAMLTPDYFFLSASEDDNPGQVDHDWTPNLPIVRVPDQDDHGYDTYWLSLREPDVDKAAQIIDQAITEVHELAATTTDYDNEYDDLLVKLRGHGIIPLAANAVTTNTF